MINQIKEKENICDKLEAEIVILRKYLEKSKTQIKFINGYKIMDNILSNQRSLDDKTGLGYKKSLKIVKGESSTNKHQQVNQWKGYKLCKCSQGKQQSA